MVMRMSVKFVRDGPEMRCQVRRRYNPTSRCRLTPGKRSPSDGLGASCAVPGVCCCGATPGAIPFFLSSTCRMDALACSTSALLVIPRPVGPSGPVRTDYLLLCVVDFGIELGHGPTGGLTAVARVVGRVSAGDPHDRDLMSAVVIPSKTANNPELVVTTRTPIDTPEFTMAETNIHVVRNNGRALCVTPCS